jgi:hypothetical protein
MSDQSLRNALQNSEAAHKDMYVSTRPGAGIVLTATNYSTLRNAQESPLLRLPPELRNEIYEYTLGGLQIRPGHRLGGPGMWQVLSKPVDADLSAPWQKMHYIAPLTLACRQIHTEAGLLPFKLNEITLGPLEPFLLAMNRLTDRQRNAIRTIRTQSDNVKHVRAMLRSPSWVPRGHLSDHATLLPLARLEGLECIVWEQNITPEGKREDGREDKDVRECILQIGGHGGLKICVDKVVVHRRRP